MTNFIPVFPLQIVVFPGEALNLHVFEPRYQDLIRECLSQQKPFGIPVVLQQQPIELGTLMEITEVVQEHPDGSLDIRTKGLQVFRLLEHITEIPDKRYSGAIVTYPENVLEPGASELSYRVIEEVRRLFTLVNLEDKFPRETVSGISYSMAHYLGLSLAEELELLGLFTELQRLEYLRRHLNRMVPVMRELEQAKARIQQNGHFRNLSAED